MLNTEHLHNLSEISAEMLVNYLYPELQEHWKPRVEGTFYRNYNTDLLHYDSSTGEIQLARDSFIRLLPQGMIFPVATDDEPQPSGEQINERRRLMLDMFNAIDTFTFRRRLQVEQQVSELLEQKLSYVLQTYFRYDLSTAPNTYVRDLAMMLPFVHSLRGDLQLVRNLLASIFDCHVNLRRRCYSESDSTRCWLPMIDYELIIPDLTQQDYEQLMLELTPVEQFIREWLLPFEAQCSITIRWHDAAPDTPTGRLLDYNTRLA